MRVMDSVIRWLAANQFLFGWLCGFVCACALLSLAGCASPPTGINSLPVQRTDDLEFPCSKCGKPATGQYEIDGGGFEDRCDEHDPEQVVPKRKARSRIERPHRRLQPTRGTLIVKG